MRALDLFENDRVEAVGYMILFSDKEDKYYANKMALTKTTHNEFPEVDCITLFNLDTNEVFDTVYSMDSDDWDNFDFLYTMNDYRYMLVHCNKKYNKIKNMSQDELNRLLLSLFNRLQFDLEFWNIQDKDAIEDCLMIANYLGNICK